MRETASGSEGRGGSGSHFAAGTGYDGVVTTRNLVFATASYGYLQDSLCAYDHCEAGEIETRPFPDGERYLRILTESVGRDIVVLGGTINDADTLTLYDLACATVGAGARTLTLVIPFFGYQTMERRVKKGEVVVAKTRARLFSSIPPAGLGNRVVLMDLHSEGIPHYFSGEVRPVHLSARSLMLAEIRRVGGEEFVLGATDAGRAKWVESLANDLGVEGAFIFKRRHDDGTTEAASMNADVHGRKVVIYDDMIRTGGSLIGAARAYLDAGATSTAAVATHGVFPGDALRRLNDSGLFTHIVCTDSHPRSLEVARESRLDVVSIAELLAEFLET
jgi:ribose-phosphate pyrophosphokinase